MKTLILLLLCIPLLGLISCQPATTSDPVQAKTIDSLTARIAALESQHTQTLMKGRLAASFGSPLDDFFNADEFWENTVDVGTSECYKRCAKAASEHRKACDALTDCKKKEDCYKEAATNVANCVQNCQ